MPPADLPPPTGGGDDDGLLDEDAGVALLQHGCARGHRFVHPAASLADQLGGGALMGVAERADPSVGHGEREPLPRVGRADILELVEVGGVLDRGYCRVHDGRGDGLANQVNYDGRGDVAGKSVHRNHFSRPQTPTL